MGSAAGSNYVNGYLLTNVGPNSGSVSAPLTGYGTFGPGGNDSGGFAVELRGFNKLRFQIIPAPGSVALSGYQVSIYGTLDPAVYQTYIYAIQGRTPQGQSALPAGGSPSNLGNAAGGFFPGIPSSSWSLLMGPSDQTGTGVSANPLTVTSPFFDGAGPVTAVRAVVTASASPAGVFSVAILSVP